MAVHTVVKQENCPTCMKKSNHTSNLVIQQKNHQKRSPPAQHSSQNYAPASHFPEGRAFKGTHHENPTIGIDPLEFLCKNLIISVDLSFNGAPLKPPFSFIIFEVFFN